MVAFATINFSQLHDKNFLNTVTLTLTANIL